MVGTKIGRLLFARLIEMVCNVRFPRERQYGY